MQSPFLIAERIYLRPLERADAATVQPWVNDPDIRPFTRATRPMSLAGEEAFIDRLRADESAIVFVIVLKDGDRPIGVTSLFTIDTCHRHAEFGISIGEKSCWSQGLGREAARTIVDYAFGTLNLNRVALFVYEYNERGIRCYEKVGFVKEGALRQEHYHEGRCWNTIVMSILRGEWERRKGGQRA